MAAGTKGQENGWFAVGRRVIWAVLAGAFLGLLFRSMDGSSVAGLVRLPASVTIYTPPSSAGGAILAPPPAAVAAPTAPLVPQAEHHAEAHAEQHNAHQDQEFKLLDLDALEASGDGEDDEIPWAALALANANAQQGSSGASGAPAAAAAEESAPASVVKAPSGAAEEEDHEGHSLDFDDLEAGGDGDEDGSDEPPALVLAGAVMAASVTKAAAQQAPLIAKSEAGCTATPEFLEYQPSAWEQEWFENAAKFQAQPQLVCQTMLAEVGRVDAWLAATEKTPEVQLDKEPDHAIFSRFKYRDPCTGKEFFSYIEPMVGHFRHPRMPESCKPGEGAQARSIQDRSYVLLQGGQQRYSRSGRGYLFDLGTNKFPTSVGWMLENYGHIGVEFNEIWAWEIKIQDPNEFWETIPPKLQPKLHFYNIPVSVLPKEPSNPLNILKEIHRPGDYTVFKLDIDNSQLELALIDQIENDQQLPALISDIMFEMHYDHPDMPWQFRLNSKKTWQDVVTTFRELRNKGLRVHYWP